MVIFLCGPIRPVLAEDAPPTDEEVYTKEMEERGRELVRAMIERFYEYLEDELHDLKKGDLESENELRQRIKELEHAIQQNPNDPEARFVLGQIYDEIGDGSGAIIQTKMAEDLYTKKKDVKGVAECRRNLRVYYHRYGFKPEDFVLIR